ncbi:hypothetical protein MVEN_00206700 [Mycena venus]|uniref:F-box domain-containing protein n=1 Tax=Mycena venus TaxID=2733690 RepID=A0A8H7DBY8_9AGAR|nr:hypothetical protein MVEN_00206700 [Mycena venus]
MNATKLSTLPTELIHTVSGHLELKDLLALCRTSHQIHAISLGWIYRAITLQNSVQMLEFCKTIISRPEAAGSVRKLVVTGNCYPKCGLKSFYSIFGSAIMTMKNLRFLDLRNPTITSLSLLPGADDPHSNYEISTTQPIRMPKLEVFHGPALVACSVVPGSRVSRIAIPWDARPVIEFSTAFATLTTSKVDITDFACTIWAWDPALLAAIATYMPRIERLQIMNMEFLSGSSSTLPKEVSNTVHYLCPRAGSLVARISFLAFDNTLRSLSRLSGLMISDMPGNHGIDQQLDLEFETVQRWAEISPVLARVTSSATMWIRLPGNLWFPGDPMQISPQTTQCLKWFIRKVLTWPDPPAAYDVMADLAGGREEMAVLRSAMERYGFVPDFDISHKENGIPFVAFPSNS